MDKVTQKGKKGRKIGRNAKSCEAYRLQNRREKNKQRRAELREKRIEKGKLKKLAKEGVE